MKYAVFNGSPRGDKSNSTRMIKWIEGVRSDEILYLNRLSRHDGYLEKAESADRILFIFPLYVDSMPAVTMSFFEKLETHREKLAGKPVYFIIHSGFPEMIQSRALARYTEYFSRKVMQMNYMGTAIIAGSEALQIAPDGAFGKLRSHLAIMSDAMERGAPFPEDINRIINRRDRLTALQRILFALNPLKNFYWNYRAKQHGMKIDLKARPYN